MYRFDPQGPGGPAVLSAGEAAGHDRRGLLRTGLAAGATMLALAGFGAGAAEATTFPGTNGRVAASGALQLAVPPTAANPSPSRLELFTIRSEYSDPAAPPADECRLTFNTNSDYNPRYSKDGKKIVYVKDQNLWTMELDAEGRCFAPALLGNEKQLTATAIDPTGGGKDSFVGGWCTDANNDEWVVFQRNMGTGASFEVYKQKVNSDRTPNGAPVRLTTNAASDSQPSVRPDCSKIAFQSSRAVSPTPPAGSSAANIYAMDFDDTDNDGNGDNLTAPLTSGHTRPNGTASEESAPAWSPGIATSEGGTGTNYRIVYHGDQDQVIGDPRNLEIYKMDYSGSAVAQTGVTRLSYSAHSGAGAGTDVTGFDLFPQYSPNGERVCFHSGRAPEHRTTGATGIIGQWEVYTLDAVNGEYHATDNTSGTATERLTNREGNDERCGWQEKP